MAACGNCWLNPSNERSIRGADKLDEILMVLPIYMNSDDLIWTGEELIYND